MKPLIWPECRDRIPPGWWGVHNMHRQPAPVHRIVPAPPTGGGIVLQALSQLPALDSAWHRVAAA